MKFFNDLLAKYFAKFLQNRKVEKDPVEKLMKDDSFFWNLGEYSYMKFMSFVFDKRTKEGQKV